MGREAEEREAKPGSSDRDEGDEGESKGIRATTAEVVEKESAEVKTSDEAE